MHTTFECTRLYPSDAACLLKFLEDLAGSPAVPRASQNVQESRPFWSLPRLLGDSRALLEPFRVLQDAPGDSVNVLKAGRDLHGAHHGRAGPPEVPRHLVLTQRPKHKHEDPITTLLKMSIQGLSLVSSILVFGTEPFRF